MFMQIVVIPYNDNPREKPECKLPRVIAIFPAEASGMTTATSVAQVQDLPQKWESNAKINPAAKHTLSTTIGMSESVGRSTFSSSRMFVPTRSDSVSGS